MNYGAEFFPYEPSTESWAGVGGLMFLYTSKCLCIGKTISYMCESGHNVFAYLSFSFLLKYVVQSLSHVQLFATRWIAAHQTPLSFITSQSLLKLMSIESVMPSNHLILCRPLLLLPSVFPSIKVFSNEPALRIRWPKYWSFSFYWSMRACSVTSVISDSLGPHRL